MIRVLQNGFLGQMGQTIYQEILKTNNLQVVGGISPRTKDYEGNVPLYTDISLVKEEADVIIDFSLPNSLNNLLEYAINNNIALVIGTTGYSEEDFKNLKDASSYIPIFYSQNMSLGVNLLLKLASISASVLHDNFDIEIIEKHHNQKVDAPSGTAFMIANKINEVLNNKMEYVYDRHEISKKRGKNEIGIQAIRGGNIVGEHDIIFAGLDEVVELKHIASSKKIFAKGAIAASQFIVNKGNSLYGMDDLLKLHP